MHNHSGTVLVALATNPFAYILQIQVMLCLFQYDVLQSSYVIHSSTLAVICLFQREFTVTLRSCN